MLILWLRGGRCDHRIQGFGWCEFLCLSDFSRARGSWKYSLSCFSEMWVSALLQQLTQSVETDGQKQMGFVSDSTAGGMYR